MNLRFALIAVIASAALLLPGCALKDIKFTGGGGTTATVEAILGIATVNAVYELNTKERAQARRVTKSLADSLRTASKGRITGVGVAKAFEDASKIEMSDRVRRIVFGAGTAAGVFVGDAIVPKAKIQHLIKQLDTLYTLLPV